MRKGIHAAYKMIQATCACGNVIIVRSTLEHDIVLDVCFACHPFYTGKQRSVDSRGRINRFNRRFKVLFSKT